MRFHRYGEYKPSGERWMGDVPSDWGIAPLKTQFSLYGGSTPKSDEGRFWDGDIVWVTPSDLNNDASLLIRDSFRKITEAGLASCGTTLVPAGSLVLSTRAPIGSLGIAAVELCTNQGCKSLVPKSEVHPLYYAFLLTTVSTELNVRGRGTTFLELSSSELGAFRVPVPSFVEQEQIASFLALETAKIDTLIAKQEKLIELLKEKRQAVISHAVTKGLDPAVPMKPSGVEWLGDVPAHWELTRLGWITAEINDINHEMPVAVDTGVPFLSAKDLLDTGELNFTENVKQISEEDFQKLSKKIQPRRDDIIYSRIGARLGKARLVETDVRFLVSYSCCVVRVYKQRAMPQYICRLLDTDLVLTEAKARTNGIGVPDLGLDEIARFPIPLPPLSVQAEIVRYLQKETEKYSLLISKAEKAIALQKEHRIALISAAVTGKIDVRDAVLGLQRAA